MPETQASGRAIGFNDQVQHAADDDSVSARWDERHMLRLQSRSPPWSQGTTLSIHASSVDE